jgi:hypothetical protein
LLRRFVVGGSFGIADGAASLRLSVDWMQHRFKLRVIRNQYPTSLE